MSHNIRAYNAAIEAGAIYYNESEFLGDPGPVREDEVADLAEALGVTEADVIAQLTHTHDLKVRAIESGELDHLTLEIIAPMGQYQTSASYVLANGDAGRELVAALLQVDVEVDEIPVVWDWDDHEALVGA